MLWSNIRLCTMIQIKKLFWKKLFRIFFILFFKTFFVDILKPMMYWIQITMSQTSKLCFQKLCFFFLIWIGLTFLTRQKILSCKWICQKITVKYFGEKNYIAFFRSIYSFFSGSHRFLHNCRINPNLKKMANMFLFFYFLIDFEIQS